MTVKDTYHLPRMDEMIDYIGDEQYFITFYEYPRYWKMNIRKKDRHKTAFVCHGVVLQCVLISFGLANTPACFQQVLDVILTNYKCKTWLVYVDDIFYNISDDHIRPFEEIIKTIL